MQVNKPNDIAGNPRPDQPADLRDDRTRQEGALNGLRNLGWTLPPDYRFSRDEANQRAPVSP
jgi:hypothetical protein